MSDHYDRYNGMEKLLGTDLATKRTVKGFPIDADLLMLKVEEEYGFRTRDRLYELIRTMPKYELPSAQPKRGKWIYHIDDLFPAESTQECDQCHAEQPLTCDDEFCPHCGADMRGERDG